MNAAPAPSVDAEPDLVRALARASAIRAERAAFLERCAAGLWAADLRVAAGELPDLRLLPVLEALAGGGGKVASRRLIADLGVAEDVTMGDLTAEKWSALTAALAGAPAS